MTTTKISVAAPDLGGRETEYVMECMTSGWISSSGRFIADFEAAFAEFCGVKHAIAVNNGTTALHLALVALDLGPGDEVLVPDLTYIASANAVRYCGATPVFVDNDPRTFNLDPDLLEAKITPRTKGIIPVHLYGHPVDMDPVMEVARRHNLFVLEDAAEAVGATYKGRRVGGIGDCATFSFFGNKIITTGEGGMVTTNNDVLAQKLRLYRSQGMDPTRRYWFPVVGYNYRMTNIAAAIGLAQMERIEDHLAMRQRVAAGYQDRLARYSDILTLPVSENWAGHVYWMYTVLINQPDLKSRDMVIETLDQAGIESRPIFYPMHVMPPYAELEGDYPNADWCSERGINLPTHGGLSEADLDRVVSVLIEALA
ncbi:MAG: aminotransferase DegT [Alphaproteobacteria bacterium PA2]|nr:MAG: aminotransferase DegT [Alphaproteobacteria bacterium PA2]